MKALITLLVFGVSLGLNAQSKKEIKLHDLYADGKYEKSEKLAKKLLSKNRSNPYALNVLGFLDLNDAKHASSVSASKRLVLKSIEKRNRITQQHQFLYKELNDSIHEYIVFLVDSDELKKKYNKAFVRLLAKEFNDTLPSFFTMNQYTVQTNVTIDFKNLSTEDSLRKVMLHFAQKLEGTPYKWAGETPKGGFDCSGFTKYVFSSIGIELPHNAQKQSELIKRHKTLENAKPGDMVFFGSYGKNTFYTQHAGIIYSITGNDIEVIHCVSNGVNIEGKDSSWEYHWKDQVLFVVDVIAEKEEVEKGKN